MSSHGSATGSSGGLDDAPVSFSDFKRKLFFVPIMLFICRLPGSFVTVLSFLRPDLSEGVFANTLRSVQAFCDPLQVRVMRPDTSRPRKQSFSPAPSLLRGV